MSQARNIANFGVHATTPDGAVTFIDDVNIAQHDGSNGLKLGGVILTKTATQLNVGASNEEATAVAVSMAIALG